MKTPKNVAQNALISKIKTLACPFYGQIRCKTLGNGGITSYLRALSQVFLDG